MQTVSLGIFTIWDKWNTTERPILFFFLFIQANSIGVNLKQHVLAHSTVGSPSPTCAHTLLSSLRRGRNKYCKDFLSPLKKKHESNHKPHINVVAWLNISFSILNYTPAACGALVTQGDRVQAKGYEQSWSFFFGRAQNPRERCLGGLGDDRTSLAAGSTTQAEFAFHLSTHLHSWTTGVC